MYWLNCGLLKTGILCVKPKVGDYFWSLSVDDCFHMCQMFCYFPMTLSPYINCILFQDRAGKRGDGVLEWDFELRECLVNQGT